MIWYEGQDEAGQGQTKRGEDKTYSTWNLRDSTVGALAEEPR